jgi:phage tail tube protein FII
MKTVDGGSVEVRLGYDDMDRDVLLKCYEAGDYADAFVSMTPTQARKLAAQLEKFATKAEAKRTKK